MSSNRVLHYLATETTERKQMQKAQPRKIRADLTPEEKERLEKFGSVDFKSAGATRKR